MIADFYKDCEVFITGGSGVVGKAAIEKLLRSSDVKKIYILLRGKKGVTVEQRLEKLKDALIFRLLKKQKPNALDKLIPIPGDAMLPNLGITPYYAKMMENVSVFFHCAATVRFNEILRIAMKLNVGGTLEALKFAETLKNLKIYLHVSTFFSNPYLETVESKMYPAPIDWKLFLKLVDDESNDEFFNTLTKKIIVGFPNTYCFTKNLAEHVVNDYCGRLPIAIYRPSIVISALVEPEPGFPPSLMGAMGLFVMTGAGLLKTVHLKSDVRLDLSPLDLCTIVMLAIAYMSAKEYENGKKLTEVPVCLGSSYRLLNNTFKDLGTMMQGNGVWERFTFNKNFLIPWCYLTSYKYVYYLLNLTHQVLPALLVDGVLKMTGNKPALMSLVRKEFTTLEIMKPFLFNNYKSDFYQKMPALIEVTNDTNFDMREALALHQSSDGLLGVLNNLVMKIREVLLREDPATLPRARNILKVKKILYNAIRGYLLYRLLSWVYCEYF